MSIRLGNVVFTVVAITVMVVTLLGYFVDGLQFLRVQLLSWGSLLAAVALVIGVFNLVRTHFNKLFAQPRNWYSAVTVIGFLGAVVAALVALAPNQPGGPADNIASRFLFQNVIVATSAALSALLVFVLVFGGYRLMRRPPTLLAVVFLLTAVVALIGMAPALAGLPDFGLRNVWVWLAQVPAVAGARGLMLGIALGIVATGLRLLLALDRPYGD